MHDAVLSSALDSKTRHALVVLEEAGSYAPAVLATSLGAEDMALLDMIDRNGLAIGVFTLDTGRLHEETYRLLQEVRQRYYKLPVAVYAPGSADLESYVAQHGPNGFYESVNLREECCRVRKVEPLKRALAGKRAWITGQRRTQSAAREKLAFKEWDADHGLHKFNPLADWSHDEVWDYLRAHQVPHNALHARGFASIGCAPCTRAIRDGEDERAGRWWWESDAPKECGIHARRKA
jgi:phosphoadenosine phosphosulfate reductase